MKKGYDYGIGVLGVVALMVFQGVALSAVKAGDRAGVPDLTLGVKPDIKGTYNLGPTGMRGWFYVEGDVTEKSRQILVSTVEQGSPADGVMRVGDVILGLDGKPFDGDARVAFGKAIDGAESETQKGVMKLLVWRAGKQQPVDLPLKVMGSYRDTAPYDCPKSMRILEAGCRYIAAKKEFGRFSIGALALLASGKPEYQALVREAVSNATPSEADMLKMQSEEGMRCWGYGYTSIFLSEYYLATGDKAVLPAIRAYSTQLAEGQGGYGTWGHGTSDRTADGKLHGPIPPYGALNQAGLICYLSLVLAQKCGIDHPELAPAIERSSRFFSYYVGKGAIPYGEHPPIVSQNNDNGKNATAALAFTILGRRPQAQYYAKTVTASGGDREWGHTGPFFGYLWGGPGANCGGPEALAAYMKDTRWLFDLARRWDGSFAYDPTGGGNGGDYNEFSTTGAYMLTYALPLRKLCIAGREAVPENWLSRKDVAEAMEAAHFDSTPLSRDALLKALGNWSPAVRNGAANALAGKPENLVPELMKIIEGPDANARIGACLALGYLKDRAAPAVPLLVRLLSHEDRWLRVNAAEALKLLGDAAKPAVPEMLKACARGDDTDSMQFAQGALAFALFYPGGALGGKGLLASSIEGVDRTLLYPAVRAVALNPDCRARGCLRSTYGLLTLDDVKVLAPDIIRSIEVIGPNNTMFAKGVQLAGIDVLARYHAVEGIPLTMFMFHWKQWGKGAIQPLALKTLKSYGGNARSSLPELKALYEVEQAKAQKELQALKENTLREEQDLKAKGLPPRIKTGRELRREGDIGSFARLLREVIDAIESDRNPPKLIKVLAP